MLLDLLIRNETEEKNQIFLGINKKKETVRRDLVDYNK